MVPAGAELAVALNVIVAVIVPVPLNVTFETVCPLLNPVPVTTSPMSILPATLVTINLRVASS